MFLLSILGVRQKWPLKNKIILFRYLVRPWFIQGQNSSVFEFFSFSVSPSIFDCFRGARVGRWGEIFGFPSAVALSYRTFTIFQWLPACKKKKKWKNEKYRTFFSPYDFLIFKKNVFHEKNFWLREKKKNYYSSRRRRPKIFFPLPIPP